MNRLLGVFLISVLIFVAGCQSIESKAAVNMDGTVMVSSKDVSDLLGLSYRAKDDSIFFSQDDIILRVNLESSRVYKDEYIMYILPKPPVRENKQVYVPMSFFTNDLKAGVGINDKNKLYRIDNSSFSLYDTVKFLPEDVLAALNDQSFPHRDEILKAVELPRSMNVEVPRIDMDKIIDTRPLQQYAIEDLKDHGYKMYEIVNLCYEDYKNIKNTWKLTAEQIDDAKKRDPELMDQDMNSWTNADYRKYRTEKEEYFSGEEKNRMIKIGVQPEDLYLLYEFTNGDLALYFDGSEDFVKEAIVTKYNEIMNQITVLADDFPNYKEGALQPENKLTAKVIDGTLMVSAQDISNILNVDLNTEQDGLIFKEDNIILKLNYNFSYVYNNDNLVYVLPGKPVNKDNTAFVPAEFLTDYLKVPLKSDHENQLYITDNGDFSLYNIAKFLPEDVYAAIYDQQHPYRDKILEAVELPGSMEIKIPNINMEKVIQITPLKAYAYDFGGDLKKHGYTDAEIAEFTYGAFSAVEKSWKLEKEMRGFTKNLYSELKYEDLSNWTYGDRENYIHYKEQMNLGSHLTQRQKEQLKQRGILLEDVHWLLKDFYQIETIMFQPDDVLKEDIQGYYQAAIDSLMQK